MDRVIPALFSAFAPRAAASGCSALLLLALSLSVAGIVEPGIAAQESPAPAPADSPAPEEKQPEPEAPAPSPAAKEPAQPDPAPAPAPAPAETTPPARTEAAPATPVHKNPAPAREPREEVRTENRRNPEPARAPNDAANRPDPEPAPGQTAPADVPAPTPIPIAQGMADELPAFDRELLPDYETLQQPPREFPHLLDDGAATPAPNNGDNGETAGDVQENGGDAQGDGPGWFSQLYDSIWADRTVRNGMIVIALILIFIVFRLRNGRGRKGYM